MSHHILIIEDEEFLRLNLAEILEIKGFTTSQAENGVAGIKLAKEMNPDLVLCDIMMPDMDGYATIKHFNEDPKLLGIPFMFLTAKAQKEDFDKGMGLGADDYITKPYQTKELISRIETRLRKVKKINSIGPNPEGLKTLYNEAKGIEGLNKLSDGGVIKNYHAQDEIYSIEKFPRYLYFVVKGIVKDVQMTDDGKELIINMYKEGDFFGYLPLLRNAVYDKTAIAMEDCEISLISKDDFNLLLRTNRDLSSKFISMLAKQTTSLESHMVTMVYGSVSKKLAEALLQLNNLSEDDNIYMTRTELANMVGSTRESVTRALTTFKKEGIVDLTNGIKILDEESLRNIDF